MSREQAEAWIDNSDTSTALMETAKVEEKPVFKLTNQQERALEALQFWWNRPKHSMSMAEFNNFILSGRPGTGKTFLAKLFVGMLRNAVPLFTAPTNEAARQLEISLQGKAPVKTTYSALGLKMSDWSAKQYIYQGRLPEDINDFNLLVVDEASMVGKQATQKDQELLMDYVQNLGMRTLWLGDDCQLPPVESVDGCSPVFNQGFQEFHLTEVVRHAGPILEFATAIREEIGKPIKNLPKVPEGIQSISRNNLESYLLSPEVFQKLRSGDARIIVWTNVAADQNNGIIRREMFGAELAKANFILPEDQILFTKPLFGRSNLERLPFAKILDEEPDLLCSINTKAEVIKTESAFVFDIPCLKAQLNVEGGQNVSAYFTTLAGEKMKQAKLKELKGIAEALSGKAAGEAWKRYHTFNAAFASVKHSYCITGHRSQGSTISDVIVDVGNMLMNRDRLVAFKNLYVAVTRAKNTLTLSRG
jgi:exodeoxyribonuclease-5